MFRKPILERRCVIPTTGFYEWKKESKEKYLFNRFEQPALYLAGMTNVFKDSGEVSVILTTEANDSVALIHNRMPVILQSEEISDWLNNDRFMYDVINRTGPVLEKYIVKK